MVGQTTTASSCHCCQGIYEQRKPLYLQSQLDALEEWWIQFKDEPAKQTPLPKHMAKEIAKAAASRSQKVMRYETAVSKQERTLRRDLMGRFEYKEIELGRMLGAGGFSHVYAILGFNATPSKKYSQDQQKDC